jgi:hypothetical protein
MRLSLRGSLILAGFALALAACAGTEARPAPTAVVKTPPPIASTATTQPADNPPAATSEPTATEVQATAAPEPMAANPTAIAELTVTAALTATPPADPGFSRSEDGYYVRGRTDAPVIVDDYSDFL